MKKICEFSGLLIYQQDQEICKENLHLVEIVDCADGGQSFSKKTLRLDPFFFFDIFVTAMNCNIQFQE